MPPDSVLVQCIRAYARYRIMIGLHCMAEDRLERLRRYISAYKNFCAVSPDSYILIVIGHNFFNSSVCRRNMEKTSNSTNNMLLFMSLRISSRRVRQTTSTLVQVKVSYKRSKRRITRQIKKMQTYRCAHYFTILSFTG